MADPRILFELHVLIRLAPTAFAETPIANTALSIEHGTGTGPRRARINRHPARGAQLVTQGHGSQSKFIGGWLGQKQQSVTLQCDARFEARHHVRLCRAVVDQFIPNIAHDVHVE